ncbi:unnamed protein product [Lepidochelys kempii]
MRSEGGGGGRGGGGRAREGVSAGSVSRGLTSCPGPALRSEDGGSPSRITLSDRPAACASRSPLRRPNAQALGAQRAPGRGDTNKNTTHKGDGSEVLPALLSSAL